MGTTGKVEKRGFAAVGISHESHSQFFASRAGGGGRMSLGVVISRYWVVLPFVDRGIKKRFSLCCLLVYCFYYFHINESSILPSEGNVVVHNAIVHRVFEGGVLYNRHAFPCNKSHFEYPFTECSTPSNPLDKDCFPCFYSRQLHKTKLTHKSQNTMLLTYLLMGISWRFLG